MLIFFGMYSSCCSLARHMGAYVLQWLLSLKLFRKYFCVMIIASELYTKQKLSVCVLVCFQITLKKDITRKLKDRL